MIYNFSNTVIGRLRLTGFAEGVSYVILLFIAIPLKYFAGLPEVVKYTGWIHGVLFILYVAALFQIRVNYPWSFKKLMLSFAASLVPFGTFMMDKQWRQEEKAVSNRG